MSERKTKCFFITTEAGKTGSFEQTQQLAKLVAQYLSRYIKKCKDYSVIAIICTSKNDIRRGVVITENNGCKGGQRIVFRPIDANDNTEVGPHMHITVLANPGETIANGVFDYLEEHQAGKVFKRRCINPEGALVYSLGQSLCVRTVSIDPNDLLLREQSFYEALYAASRVVPAHNLTNILSRYHSAKTVSRHVEYYRDNNFSEFYSCENEDNTDNSLEKLADLSNILFNVSKHYFIRANTSARILQPNQFQDYKNNQVVSKYASNAKFSVSDTKNNLLIRPRPPPRSSNCANNFENRYSIFKLTM